MSGHEEGVIGVRWHKGLISYAFPASLLSNVRCLASVGLLQTMHLHGDFASNPSEGTAWLQCEDRAKVNVRSVAFGRQKYGFSDVGLIPDPYFVESSGFETIRRAVLEQRLPPWNDRKAALFWRGSATFHAMTILKPE